ncbi:unnamed protein product [Rhizoctonia solani]|uniref:F-box domain-containing protein n=1 Tax=Rhizoctonia solani TaxID=456999 RepID=A0A8H2XYF9_9AGAM|nr:unnamed protein product [Rhizoctonia solani]CAE6491113.1 unnamed protein product [Rhizoctonia solani]
MREDKLIAAFEQWEQASAALTSSVSHFFDLSVYLEAQCTTSHANSPVMITRIDSSLDTLQKTINQKLDYARVALAKTRNKLASQGSILSLPLEIIAEIFRNVIYDPPSFSCSTAMPMERRVELIYSRLHCLLGVCTAWRDVGISCAGFWSVVPVVDNVSGGLRSQSIDLSLQRARDSEALYLAMTLARNAHLTLDSLRGHLSRFSVINIHENFFSSASLSDVLSMIFEEDGPRSLSKLYLRYSGRRPARHFRQPTKPLDDSFASLQPQIINLVNSLSALRLHAVALNWAKVAFSNRLVTLQIGRISLGCQPGINNFISALASATELRELALAYIEGVLDQDTSIPAGILVLPKLESLHLQALVFNILFLFIRIITPNSYNLTLDFRPGTSTGHVLAADTFMLPVAVTHNELYPRLKGIKIGKLVLDWERDCAWDSGVNLQALLQTATAVKTLVLNSYKLNQATLKSLTPPLNSSPETLGRDEDFPKLEAIEIHRCTLKCPLTDLRPVFEELLANHPIQRLVLGRFCDGSDNGAQPDSTEENEDMIKWLEEAVPHFFWLPRQTSAPEMMDTWQLWDV